MKIAIIVYNLTGGGAERVASLWMKGFHDSGHTVYAILGDTYDPITYTIPKEIKVYGIHPRIRNHTLRYAFMRIFRNYKVQKLKKIFDETNPDLVICVCPAWGKLVYAAQGSHKFKVIGTDHNSYEVPNYMQLSKEQQYFKFEFNKNFDHITVLTQADKDVIGNRFSNVTVLPNPLGLKPSNSVPPKKKIILASGRLNAWHVKGFDLLIESWGRICKSYPDWTLRIVGGGSKESVHIIKSLINKANCTEQVELVGYSKNIQAQYQESSIFVLSSRYEGFGMVLIEAMSQGCACIACDFRGRQSEIIRNEHEGVICPIDDVNALSVAIARLITDNHYRNDLQKSSIIRAEDFSLDNIMNKWNTILKSMDLPK